jgi:hypothetical protein
MPQKIDHYKSSDGKNQKKRAGQRPARLNKTKLNQAN